VSPRQVAENSLSSPPIHMLPRADCEEPKRTNWETDRPHRMMPASPLTDNEAGILSPFFNRPLKTMKIKRPRIKRKPMPIKICRRAKANEGLAPDSRQRSRRLPNEGQKSESQIETKSRKCQSRQIGSRWLLLLKAHQEAITQEPSW
jgi:hypothetical protein